MEELNVKSEKKLEDQKLMYAGTCMYCVSRVNKKCVIKDEFTAKKKSCAEFKRRKA